MAVKNFYLKGRSDDGRTGVHLGPHSRGAGVEMEVWLRRDGMPVKVAYLKGFASPDSGELRYELDLLEEWVISETGVDGRPKTLEIRGRR